MRDMECIYIKVHLYKNNGDIKSYFNYPEIKFIYHIMKFWEEISREKQIFVYSLYCFLKNYDKLQKEVL